MSGYSAVITTGRYSPPEVSTLFLPRVIRSSRRAVLYAHGATGDGTQAIDGYAHPGVVLQIASLVANGLVVLAGDFGGSSTMGNDTGLTAMEGAWSYLQSSGYCATDKLILTGGSMGFMSISRFALAHPTSVAGMIGWIPAIDIEDVRTRDPLSLRAPINTAWALPVGSYIGGADQTPVPTRGKPLDPSNLSAVNAIPTHLFYSSADTVCTSTAVDTYAAGRANVTKHLVSSSLDHSDTAVRAADIPTAVAFAQSVA